MKALLVSSFLRRWLVLGAPWLFIFVQPLPHSAALRNVGLLWLIAATAWVSFHRVRYIDMRSPLLRALALLLCVLLLSALGGIDAWGSVETLRKDFLAPLLALYILLSYCSEDDVLRLVIAAAVAGFALRTGLVLSEWRLIAPDHRLEAEWVKGYAMTAVLFLPLTATAALASPAPKWGRWGLIMLYAIELLAVVAYESRTALVAIGISVFLAVLLSGRKRLILVLALAGCTAFGSVATLKPQLLERYAALFKASSYEGPQGMSARYPIWTGVADLVRDRPWFGYGQGWKKMASVARESGHLERWRQGTSVEKMSADYFDHDGGTVNPHNVFLQILFEAGAVGLAAYGLLWGIFTRLAYLAWRQRNSGDFHQVAGIAGLSFVAAFLVMNVSNGLWPLPGPVIGLFAMVEMSRRRLACVD